MPSTTFNIWDDWHPFIRGRAIEELWGRNLPKGFRIIDNFETGVATSYKSINLADETYQTASQLRSVLIGYVTKLETFTGGTFDGVTILGSQIVTKKLRVAIPPALRYVPSRAQLDVLDEIRRLCDEKGIRVIFEEVPG